MSDPLVPELSIPWKIIAASQDMMDVSYNNDTYPYVWRSSLAFSVFEPSENLPVHLCGQKFAFVKVTCSITGYQPRDEERQVIFPSRAEEEIERALTAYWGCYGVLLNVAIFPLGPRPPNFRDYPHIVDFLPKNRELLRPVTSTGEVLTASTSSLQVDSGLTTTKKNETQVGIKAGYEKTGAKIEGSIQHTWGTTTEAKSETAVGDGTERRLTSGYSTSIDHLYSLLTGYHAGTNRAAFIMLPRPFLEESTDRRTFAPGLRVIEGVQEFVLVVARPEAMRGLCIEASLETAHFPDEVDYERRPAEYETRDASFRTVAHAGSGSFGIGVQTVQLEHVPSAIFSAPEGWVIDRTAAGGGVEETANHSTPTANHNLRAYHFAATNDRTVRVTGELWGGNFGWDDATFDRTYVVHLRSVAEANPATAQITTSMLTTSRHLSACYESRNSCPEAPELMLGVLPDAQRVREALLSFSPSSNQPGLLFNTLTNQIQATLVAHASPRSRLPAMLFTETDYFKNLVVKHVPGDQKKMPLTAIGPLPEKFEHARDLSIEALLSKDLAALRAQLGLNPEDALQLRQMIMRHLGGPPK